MKDFKFAQRIKSISTPKSIDIAEKAKSLVFMGEDVIDFSWVSDTSVLPLPNRRIG